MMRLIDADLAAAFAENCGATFVAKRLRDSTAFSEDVVRCRNCKAWMRNTGIVDSPNGQCFEHDITTNGHDFCSYGERKISK